MSNLGDVWVIAGAPGAGKSYFAERFVRLFTTPPALIDKDSMYNQLIDAVLIESGRLIGERESGWYNTHIKAHTYGGMIAVAEQVRRNGCGVVLTAPYTELLYTEGAWETFVDAVGGATVRLIWIRTDFETLRFRLSTRGFERDGDKLASFDTYASGMHLNDFPIVNYVEIDNRLNAAKTIELQVYSAMPTNFAPVDVADPEKTASPKQKTPPSSAARR